MGADRYEAKRPVIEGLCWAGLIAGLSLWLSFAPRNPDVNVVAGVATILFGVRVFLGHGGSRVTILGLASLATSMFVGVAGVYAALDPLSRAQNDYLGHAILAGLALALLTALIAWPQVREITFQPAPDRVAHWLTLLGGIALASLIGLQVVGVGFASWLEGAAFTATVALAAGILWRANAKLLSPSMVLVVAAFVAYALVFHTGGGRLRIVALACALAVLVTARFPWKPLKWGIVLATPLALYVLAQQRLTLQEQMAGFATDRNGLESMLVPIVNLAVLLKEQAEGMALDFGAHFLSIPATFLPASWVGGAPPALGYQLVAVQDPSRVGTGFSTAGTIAAEPVYSFGLAGILLAAPILAWLFRALDNQIAAIASREHATRGAVLMLVLWVMIGGAVADLAWSGTHTLVMRTALRLPLWLGLAVLAHLVDRLEGGQRQQRGPKRIIFNESTVT
ncbi:hypothetical protein [Georgenia sp. MJ170]|uniref:hypothetical protein n=1 Tax=Georgenia sunbinii TaxID=3117728 RepID=UPI002F265443